MKKILLVALSGLAIVMATEAAQALTITGNVDVGAIDTWLDKTNLINSGYATETEWVQHTLTTNVEAVWKINDLNETNWYAVEGNSGVYALSLGTYEPGYFLVKTGNITNGDKQKKAPNQNPDHFLFANNDKLGWAVIDLEDLGITDISNIGKVSHVTLFSGDPVPEPATMILFGAGLAGLAGIRRRKQA